ncbi:hypothetical protein GURKE_02220 [Brevundimonas phage vB_BpoS-Gurke]|uniref:Uncharacterized protein n=1 Tax=Brevundimonas phage vB_BpoS-Gurke TaxID=2948599 RepID=A0A9E7N1Y5_9CAUD|nr:hypothetical protein GURKE_02220 [Brevundimonas phage vB_BpoS-Gurke]
MTNSWKPRVGEWVKMTHTRTWGERRGVPHSIHLSQVKKVTPAGYVYVTDKFREKFVPSDNRYNEFQPKSLGFRDWHVYIEPASEEEIKTMPRTPQAGREYASRHMFEEK